ncbi:MAG: T3SS effector HopA1 family protein [Cytophagales bacterium]|nr:T3SS effector HopA1 family protein [Cytophagales bacterium]
MLYNDLQADKAPKKGAGKQGKSRSPVYAPSAYFIDPHPIQAMLEMASFKKPVLVSFKQKTSDNFVPPPSRLVNPGEYFLWDSSGDQKPGEYLIGLPQGFYMSAIQPALWPAPLHFHSFMYWLKHLWEKNMQALIKREPMRMQFTNSLYISAAYRKIQPPPYSGNYTEGFLRALKPVAETINLLGQSDTAVLTSPSQWNHLVSEDSFKHDFIYIYSKTKGDKSYFFSEFRIYINVLPRHMPEVLRFLGEQVICNPAFRTIRLMKMANEELMMSRTDNTLVYLYGDRELDAILSVIMGLHRQCPHFFGEELPPMVEPQAHGIGIAETPHSGLKNVQKAVPFSYSRKKATAARTALEKKAAENSGFADNATGTAELMKNLEEQSALFGDQVKALPNAALKKVQDYYMFHFHEEFPEWKEMLSTAKHRPLHREIVPRGLCSFLEMRSSVISEALIDTLHLGFGAFVCEVWRKFEEANLNFFNPSRNLSSYPQPEAVRIPEPK